jgi:prepilin-type N-terminal cleavage/methylation domain-containing protein
MKSEKGFSLIEVLISLAIIGIVSVGFLSALATSSKAAVKNDQIDTARTLAQSQMEYVRKQPYASTYTPESISGSDYAGYSASITTSSLVQRDSLIQKISVTIYKAGSSVTTLDGCKVK